MGGASDIEFSNFIERLLARTDIIKLIARHTKLKKTSGGNYSGLCPFHNEKTPSFSVSETKGMYYCFGCGAKGNAITFLKEKEGRNAAESIRELAQMAGMEMPRSESGDPKRQAHRKALYEILQQAADFYRRQLREHPQRHTAVDYLKKRGLSGSVARDFELGFAPADANMLIQALGDTQPRRELLQAAGLARQNNSGLYGFLYNRIVFPIRDRAGRVVAFGGRALDAGAKAKYLNSPESEVFSKRRELYGLHPVIQQRPAPQQLLLVEGYMDVVMLAQHGFRCAVAVLGSAANSDHFEMMFRQARRVVLCFDGDEAGLRAARRAVEAAMPSMKDGHELRVLTLPEGEDPDSLVRAENGPERFARMLDEESQSLMNFLFKHLGAGADLDSADRRAALIEQIQPYIRSCPSPVLRALLCDELADAIDLDRDELKRLIAAASDAERASPYKSPPYESSSGPYPADDPPYPPPHRDFEPRALTHTPVARLLALLFQHPALIHEIDAEFEAPSEASEENRALNMLLRLLRDATEPNCGWLQRALESEDQQLVRVVQRQIDHCPSIADYNSAATELRDTLRHLRERPMRNRHKEELKALMNKDADSRSDADRARITELIQNIG